MRQYVPGDRLSWIDWNASARLSRLRDEDVFVVRQYYEEVAPRVVVVTDRRPSMGLYAPPFPWLSKVDAMREATTAIIAAAHAARAYVGYLDVGRRADGEVAPHWIAPNRQSGRQISHRLGLGFDAPQGSLELALDYLLTRRQDVPAGSFVFLLSDFLDPPGRHVWSRGYAAGWEIVPVVVQDPVWEQSFPPVEGLLLPISDPRSGSIGSLRLTRDDVAERREANAARLRNLLQDFRAHRLEPVVVGTSDPFAIDEAFIRWASRRRMRRAR